MNLKASIQKLTDEELGAKNRLRAELRQKVKKYFGVIDG